MNSKKVTGMSQEAEMIEAKQKNKSWGEQQFASIDHFPPTEYRCPVCGNTDWRGWSRVGMKICTGRKSYPGYVG
jgi:hypothetical protein